MGTVMRSADFVEIYSFLFYKSVLYLLPCRHEAWTDYGISGKRIGMGLATAQMGLCILALAVGKRNGRGIRPDPETKNLIEKQSRSVRVKCRLDGELPAGRKGQRSLCGAWSASRCKEGNPQVCLLCAARGLQRR